jgi:hypothetical protein
MAYYHTVTIVRKSQRVTKAFTPHDENGSVDAFIRAAILMPKTVRVEVTEEDTQLYAYPANKRSYQRAVVLKDGRAYKFHGHGCGVAFLHEGPLQTLRIA